MQKIKTFLMFEGKAEEAIRFYTSLFQDSVVVALVRYDAAGPGEAGKVQKALFTLNGQQFMAIDSPIHHEFTFTPATSLFVDCDGDEIDDLAAKLSEGGSILMPLGNYGFSQKFCWLNDRYGVSWQLNFS
ncbi:MAG: VOC family protein [Cyanobacteria bacterium SZAS TMP-1]|nr:VOC family protein [Cyanobacteria bacterium SZAS TMP-1]